MNIQPFIFNWKGQFEKTCQKEEQLKKIFDKVIVINSDDTNEKPEWINVGDDYYFTDQFLKAVEVFDGDVMFHIQADASYDDFESLIGDAKKYYDEYEWGVYAPNVDYTWYTSQNTDIESLKSSHLNIKMVSDPDCTCWFIHKDVIDDFKNRNIDMSDQKMGWGIDISICGLSFLRGRPVIRDYNHTVDHPPGTNYNKEVAANEMGILWNRLDDDMKQVISYIKGDREKLQNYFQ
jgi:hypothetical protein